MPEVVIGSDHPALPGHFPGHPIVPAAVILSRVLAEVRRAHPELGVTGVRKAKFLRPLGPDEAFSIEFGSPTDDTLKFACRTGDAVLAQGRFTLGGKPGATDAMHSTE